ncbi:hypothetical protein EG329_003446 [Mollisiaceae sp. DMI_Dod_QoI]|nr:hypothetical protein EG329_003446 [Helotiales sp. DMI_Dod_QoI]
MEMKLPQLRAINYLPVQHPLSSSQVEEISTTDQVYLSSLLATTIPILASGGETSSLFSTQAVPPLEKETSSSALEQQQVASSEGISTIVIPSATNSPQLQLSPEATTPSTTELQIAPGETISSGTDDQIIPQATTPSTNSDDVILPPSTALQQATLGTTQPHDVNTVAEIESSTNLPVLLATPTPINQISPMLSATAQNTRPQSTSAVVLQIQAIGQQKFKRQSSFDFLTPNSADGQVACDSTTFTLSDGQLFTSDGRYLSTDDGVTWMPFQASSPALPISLQFGIDQNGYLEWNNVAFSGGTALFCQQPSGEVVVLFQGTTDGEDDSYPAFGTTCVPVELEIVSSSICYNSTMGITASEVNGGAAPTGTCPVYPASWYTYSPTGQSCVPHTLTWEQFGCTPLPAVFF